MHPPTAAELQAGDVVLRHDRYFVLVREAKAGAGNWCMVAIHRGRLDRHRADVFPKDASELTVAGLPLTDIVVRCNRLVPIGAGRVMRLGTVAAGMLNRIGVALHREAAATEIERSPAVRSTLDAIGDEAGYGRKIGRQQAT